MIHATRTVLWLPFAILSNIPILIVTNIVVGYYATYGYPFFLFGSIVVCGLSMPFEASLRPPMRHKLKLPPRSQLILPSLALIAVKARRRAPHAAKIAKALRPELRRLLANPVDRQPEAVAHDRRIAELAR